MSYQCSSCGSFASEIWECNEPGCSNDTCPTCEDDFGRCHVCHSSAHAPLDYLAPLFERGFVPPAHRQLAGMQDDGLVNNRKEMTMVKLGRKYRDTISGFEGTAVAITEWLYGCRRVGLAPHELKDGQLIENQWFDEQQLVEVMGDGDRVALPRDPGVNPGGPRQDPAAHRSGE